MWHMQLGRYKVLNFKFLSYTYFYYKIWYSILIYLLIHLFIYLCM